MAIKMKILYLTNLPSPYRVDFFNELGKKSSLTVLFERRHANDREKDWISENVVNFEAIFLKGINIGMDGAFCPTVVNWLKRRKYDVFVIGGYSTPTGMLAIQALKIKKIPFFLNIDGGMIKEDKFFNLHVKRYLIGSAKWWLSSGESTNSYLKHYGADLDKTYIYPFTSLKKKDIFEKPALRKQKQELRKALELKDTKTIISVGRFIDGKGFETLIKSWPSVDEPCQLIIIGGGPKKDSYLELISKMKIDNIIVRDFVDKEKLKEYYRASDLFVFSTESDVWGLVINEAMASGLPIISTDRCVAAVELVQNGENGYIVPVNEGDTMVERINSILSDEKLQHNMGIKNIKIINNYTIEKMAEIHYTIFIKK